MKSIYSCLWALLLAGGVVLLTGELGVRAYVLVACIAMAAAGMWMMMWPVGKGRQDR